MPPIPTFWMRQRQVKVEETGPESVKLTAPNLPAYELRLQPTENGLAALLYRAGELETPVAVRPTGFTDPVRAWESAFELYRQEVIV